jgi:hypothetical protein
VAICEQVNPKETHHGNREINVHVIGIIIPPNVVMSSPDLPMPCIENAKYDNSQAV